MENSTSDGKSSDNKTEIKSGDNWFRRFWNDPVWSKVISALIIGLLTLVYALLISLFKDINIQKINLYGIWSNAIHFKIEAYQLFLTIIALTTVYAIIIIYKRKKSRKSLVVGSFNVEEKIGEFTFRELYNALNSNFLATPVTFREHGWQEKTDLLTLFIVYQRLLNVGVDIDSPGQEANFLYFQVAPSLMSYRVVEARVTNSLSDNQEITSLTTSNIGYKFLNFLEKYRVYSQETLDKEQLTAESEQN